MKNTKGVSSGKFISSAAVFMSAAIILGGTGGRTKVSASYGYSDTAVRSVVREASKDDSPSYITADIPMTAGTAADVYARDSRRNIGVYIDGKAYSGRAFLHKDTTYVGIREFVSAFAGATVSWNSSTATATAKTAYTTVTATKGRDYISSNGRYFWAKPGIIIENGTMYVPLRPLCLAYGATLSWDGSSYTVNITSGSGTVKPGSSYYDSDEVYWLSKIIHAESRGESMTGKIAVGNVVLNRVRSKDYPNTIYGVIFDKKYGVQFSPVLDGTIHLEPDADSVIAAKLCLEGYSVSDSILFFINKNLATNMWVTNTRPLEVSIGKHDFYA